MVETGDCVGKFAVCDWVVGQMAGGQDAGDEEDLLVDDLVTDVTGDGLVGAEPVL